MKTHHQIRAAFLLFAFFLSGACALGYEMLWIRLLGLVLGHEMLGVLAVLAGFFAGLALGAALLDGKVRRSRNPAQLFAVLESLTAVYALASPHLLHVLSRLLPPIIGPHAGDNDNPVALLLSLGISTTVLLPGTFCLGATLSALVEAWKRSHPDEYPGRTIGRLYAVNTLGAGIGLFASVHLILPGLGLAAGAALLSGIGFLAAALAWMGSTPSSPVDPATDKGRSSREPAPAEYRYFYVALFGSGCAAIGLEIVVVQILSQVLKGTVFTFAHLLAVYLAGTAIGSWLYSRLGARLASRQPHLFAATLLACSAFVAVILAFVLPACVDALEPLVPKEGVFGHYLYEVLLAVAVFLVPCAIMGALFSHLVGLLAPRGVGKAYAVNTLGGMVAPFCFGLFAVNTFGYAEALYSVAYTYMALFVFLMFSLRVSVSWAVAWAVLFVGVRVWAPSSLSSADVRR